MKYKIIVDSSCDLNQNYLNALGIDFAIVPFTVNVGDKEFVDTEEVNTEDLLTELENFSGKPVSACPSPQAFLDQLSGADKYFIITISSKLSGCYNSAVVAKNSFASPKDVFVIDSKLTAGAMVLIVDKLVSFIQDDLPFNTICHNITDYANENIDLLFTLKDYTNFVKNGRLTPMQALIATTLRITPICAGENGEIKIIKKLLGSKRVMKEMLEIIRQKKEKFSFSKCIISHADNLAQAKQIQSELKEKNLFSKIEITPMRVLCSFYAMRKGIIISFEK